VPNVTTAPVSTPTKVARTIAVLLVAWSAWLALNGPSIPSSDYAWSYECPAPISYAFSDGLGDVPEWVDGDCRRHAVGTGIAIGMFGNIVAILLYFTRPPARHAEPLPPGPPKKPKKPKKPAEPPIQSTEDEAGLWNPALRQSRPEEPPEQSARP
jgi:hypothetical protein